MHENLLDKIRLKEFELKAILQSFQQFFLPEDHLWVFGSRADLSKRGGDIDLYVETNLSATEAYTARVKFDHAICDAIGEQKIDIVLHIMADDLNLAIYAVAKSEGVQIA